MEPVDLRAKVQNLLTVSDDTIRRFCSQWYGDGHLGRELFHFMGTSTFSEYTVCAEISVAKVNPSRLETAFVGVTPRSGPATLLR